MKGIAGRARMVAGMPNSGMRLKLKATSGKVARVAATDTMMAAAVQARKCLDHTCHHGLSGATLALIAAETLAW
jgi:hypothetical protein